MSMLSITDNFSWTRLWAIVVKEFNQFKRDHTTFAMILGIPLVQILLFGYAINVNPKNLPIAVLSSDNSIFTRTLISKLETTKYFRVTNTVNTEAEAENLIRTGKVQFVLSIPTDFSRKFIRGEKPAVLLEVDAADPASVGNALGALNALGPALFNVDLTGSLSYLQPSTPPATINTHLRYNPNQITQYNVVPGLIGIILTMTLVMVTAMIITRERERGTIETLLTTPARPLEVIVGKSLPYVIVGYLQMALLVIVAKVLFDIPMFGSLFVLVVATLPFILGNLLVGIAFSTIAQTQLQASQMTMFFFLPSLLLSGFAFPFRGMPEWAQWIGQCLPMTHYVNISRGIFLKGNGWIEIWPDLWPILLFMVVATFVGVTRYRQTLD
jgi:ABC-2 type transport system permease protein